MKVFQTSNKNIKIIFENLDLLKQIKQVEKNFKNTTVIESNQNLEEIGIKIK